MQKVTIQEVTLNNFKGIDNKVITLNGMNGTISGHNGVGKTTIADSIIFALTGKLTTGKKADPQIKEFEAGSQVQDNGKPHSVELLLNVGKSRKLKIKRTFSEAFTGKTKKTFKGHSTELIINDCPCSVTDFKRYLSEALNGINEEQILSLMLPGQFAAMKWQDRRALLLKLIDPVDFDTVANADRRLYNLPKAVDIRLLKNLTFFTDEVKKLKGLIKTDKEKLAVIPAVVTELKNQMTNVKVESGESIEQVLEMIRTERFGFGAGDDLIVDVLKKLGNLRQRQLETGLTRDEVCRQIKALKDEYNLLMKGEVTQAVNQRVLEMSKIVGRLKNQRTELTANFETLQEQINVVKKQYDEIISSFNPTKSLLDSFEEQIKAALKTEIQITESALDTKLQIRIDELMKSETEIAGRIESNEQTLFLIDLYLSTRARVQEEAINGLFSKVKFKLSEMQINGEEVPACEMVYCEVPRDDGLNKAAKLTADLDIIKSLQKAYQIEMPVLIDEAESYNEVPEMDNQIVQFKVSDGELKAEVEGLKAERG